MENRSYSILFPYGEDTGYKRLSETAFHDIGLDILCSRVTNDPAENRYISQVLSGMTADSHTAEYRQKVFADIMKLPKLRERMKELFEKLEYMRKFGNIHMDTGEKLGFWLLMHRLNDIDDYIKCVEAMREVLSDESISSEGLTGLRSFVDELYDEACFKAMKKDIAELKLRASSVKSVTVGINVNTRFEATSFGLVSVNEKPFRKSGVVGSFADAILAKDRINKECEWDGDMHYYQSDRQNPRKIAGFLEKTGMMISAQSTPFMDASIRNTIVQAVNSDETKGVTFHLDRVLGRILASLLKKLRDTMDRYADIAVVNISKLIPEFMYYIRFAEFIEKCMSEGMNFCEPCLIGEGSVSMEARGFYNMKLAVCMDNIGELVSNDLVFDRENTVYILTGANQGGKTTVTQGIGIMFAMAQGGIFVPAESFRYKPADCIYTHFPADEDKTLDLGRLGEECVRFKDIYNECTDKSLVLLNETFSTTSFEEGYYIAKDSLKAILKKGCRTIYNTHMHKLGTDIDEMNSTDGDAKAASLIVRTDEGKRSFKVVAAPPDGMSYAKDIAEKYGVTYDMLTKGS